MNAEFDWWLLLVGIVAGAGLVWLVLADFRRTDDELEADERRLETEWISDVLREAGRKVDDREVEEILDLHRAYVAGPPPDLDPVEQSATAATPAPVGRGPAAAAVPSPSPWPPSPVSERAPAPGATQPRRVPGDGS